MKKNISEWKDHMLHKLTHQFCSHLWLALGVIFLLVVVGCNPGIKSAVIENIKPVSTSTVTVAPRTLNDVSATSTALLPRIIANRKAAEFVALNRLGKGGVRYVLRNSPDGEILATGSEDGVVQLWRAADGELLNTLLGHNGYIISLMFTPDGYLMTNGSVDGAAILWGGYPLLKEPKKGASNFRLVSVRSFESYIYECGWPHEGVCLGANLEVSNNF